MGWVFMKFAPRLFSLFFSFLSFPFFLFFPPLCFPSCFSGVSWLCRHRSNLFKSITRYLASGHVSRLMYTKSIMSYQVGTRVLSDVGSLCILYVPYNYTLIQGLQRNGFSCQESECILQVCLTCASRKSYKQLQFHKTLLQP